MLRVTVELCPGGSEMGRKILAEGVIFQDTESMTMDQRDMTFQRNYQAAFRSRNLDGEVVGGKCRVDGFNRRRSSLELLKESLNNLELE